ncbi:MAG: alpha-hydroxy-acid oxidizing protein [Steroidobacteraceae bacterium]
MSSAGVEAVNAARGESVWFQLYPTDQWPVASALVRPSKPMFRELDVQTIEDLTPLDMNRDHVKRLRDLWPRKLVIKGLVTREDALLAVAHGFGGIIVANDGGRAKDSGRGIDRQSHRSRAGARFVIHQPALESPGSLPSMAVIAQPRE